MPQAAVKNGNFQRAKVRPPLLKPTNTFPNFRTVITNTPEPASPFGSTYKYTLSVTGLDSITVEFKSLSSGGIDMTSTLTCASECSDLFSDTNRCGDSQCPKVRGCNFFKVLADRKLFPTDFNL